MLSILHIWSLLDSTSDGISLHNIFDKEFRIFLSHVCVTVMLGTCIAPIGLDLNNYASIKTWYRQTLPGS